MISRIDHVSIAVPDAGQARDFFTRLFGAIPGAHDTDDHLQYTWRMFSMGDLSRLELLNPRGKDGFLKGFLTKHPNGGVHHITLETPDIQESVRVLAENRIPCFGYRDYGDAWKEVFIHPKDAFGVLIQIAQFNPDDFLGPEVKLPGGQRWAIEKKADGKRVCFRHPGGGTATLDLSAKEVTRLIRDLADDSS